MSYRSYFTVVVCFVSLLAAVPPLCALEYRDAAYGYYLDLPDGWSLLSEDGHGGSSFCDAAASAVLQVLVTPGGAYASAFDLYLDIRKRLGASGDGERFDFSGRDAVFAAQTFSAANVPVQGYFVFIRVEADYALLAFAPEKEFPGKEDALISALNAFSPDRIGESLPGPISQYLTPLLPPASEPQTVNILGKDVTVAVDPRAFENSQALIEREARLLSKSTDGWISAWQRYYRIVFRDSFFRLSEFGASLAAVVEEKAIPDENVPREVLTWIQNFSYERTGTFSDLLSPVEAARTLTGDCDSRSLLYVILLRYLSLDSAMFISKKFAHSLGGVAVSGKGARLEAGGRSYLVAETTAHVELGMIDRSMADPAEWIPVPLPVVSGM